MTRLGLGTSRPAGLALALGLVIVLAVLAPSAARAGARPGRDYDASSRGGALSFRFHVTRDGRRIVDASLFDLEVRCHGSTVSVGTDFSGDRLPPFLRPSHAAIGRRGRFSFRLGNSSGTLFGTAGPPVVVTGRFGRNQSASGLATYRGRGDTRGCNARVRWTAPAPPPELRFTGRTARGQPVVLYRTIGASPVAVDFSFGSARATCPDGSTERKTIGSVAQFRIRRNRFSGTDSSTSGEAITLAGRFTGPRTVVGTVGLAGRDDCSVRGIHWTAHLSGRR